MQSKLYELSLPPLKRYKLYHQESVTHHQFPKHIGSKSPQRSNLPAKKRKASRVPNSPPVYSLPAKKRIWAIPPFDLNLVPKEQEKIGDDNVGGGGGGGEEDGEDDDDDDDDDGVVCCVCLSCDGDEEDPIVFCDGCDVMVHCSCYGYPLVKGVPDGDWFCDQCLESKIPGSRIEGGKRCVCDVSEGKKRCVCDVSEGKKRCVCPVSEGKKRCLCDASLEKKCCLCPVSGGAMKATTDGKWAHLVCALFIPEVFFDDSEGRKGIDCSKVPRRRFKEVCYLCESKKGCVLECSEAKCPLSFHVTCGVKEDLYVEYQQGKKKSDVVAGFCRKHTDLWQKQQQSGKYKIVARD